MASLLDLLSALISLAFLSILGLVGGVAIPGLFIAALAPWLDRVLPTHRNQSAGR